MSKVPALSRSLVCIALATACLGSLAQTAAPSALTTPIRSPRVAQEVSDYIVALVNSEPITYRQVAVQVQRAEQRLLASGAQVPKRQLLEREALDRLINERVQVQVAREMGLKVSTPELDGAIASIASQNNISVAQLMEQLRKERINQDRFKADIEDELLIMKLRERDLEFRATVTDSELDDHMRLMQSAPAASAVEINLGQILIAVPDGADNATVQAKLQLAQSVLARAKAGENFVKLANEFSQADKASANGMGLKSSARYPQLFVDAVTSLSPGDLSEVIRSGAGFHVLKLLERSREGMPSQLVQQTRARHILIKISPSMPEPRARQLLAQVRERIVSKNATFEAMARQYSQDGSADEGGELGWVGPGQFVPEFENVMNQLAPGVLSEPVSTRFGLHLIEVRERRSHKLSQSEFREMVRQSLRDRKIEEAFPKWLQELRSGAYVEFRQAPDQ